MISGDKVVQADQGRRRDPFKTIYRTLSFLLLIKRTSTVERVLQTATDSVCDHCKSQLRSGFLSSELPGYLRSQWD